MSRSSTAKRGRRWAVVAALLGCSAWSALARPATAAPGATELVCGETASGALAPGESALFYFDAMPGEAIAIEAVDVSGNQELLQLRLDGPDLRLNTCTGRLQPTMERPAMAHLAGGRYTLEISDCREDAGVEYAVTLNLLSGSSRTCGRTAPCEESLPAAISAPGEVDSFRFAARRDEIVTLDFPGLLDSRGGMEVRVFDPDGLPIAEADGCGVRRTFATPKLGTYTVLANACFGYGTGNYQLRWDTDDDCPPLLLRGVHSGGETFEVAISANGERVVRVAGAGLHCSFASLAEFRSPLGVRTVDGAFSVAALEIESPSGAGAAQVSVDGYIFDGDGDGAPDQAYGGVKLATEGGVCVFQWVATNGTDADLDGWNDIAERRLGAHPDSNASVPESGILPGTTLFGPGVCLDVDDNDADGAADTADANCLSQPPLAAVPPTSYAGRHSAGPAFWIERAADGIVSLDARDLDCPDFSLDRLHLPLALPVTETGRFGAQRLPLEEFAEAATLDFDGVFFDLDGDGVEEQAVGGLAIARGADRCAKPWAATPHLDSDNDGWSDVVERRLGSDPRPLPDGVGGASVPEHRLVPRSLVAGGDVCADGLDNDGDGRTDEQDTPACPPRPTATPLAATPTPPATPTSTSTPTRTLTPIVGVTEPTEGTPTPSPAACVGDCDGNRSITVDEIVTLVAVSLGSAPLGCVAGDVDASGTITVDEIVAALTRALTGCSSAS